MAALSARAFLDSLSKQVVRDVQDVKQHARATQASVDANLERVELVEEAMDKRSSDQVSSPVRITGSSVSDEPVPDISHRERQALSAMMNITYRTQTGIARDIGLPRTQVGELIDALASKRLVERTASPNTGGPRWRITPLGVHALNVSADTTPEK